jgi:hypothetical protein
MSIALQDRTARLLDLPPQRLGPLQERASQNGPGGSSVSTDRGRGTFHRIRRGSRPLPRETRSIHA